MSLFISPDPVGAYCHVGAGVLATVIPAKLATAGASRNPGVMVGLGSRFRENDGGSHL
jgi:hypothetical protein